MRLTKFSVALIVSVIVSVVGGIGSQSCRAQGVAVTPLRVLFDGRTRSTTVFLSNRTSTANTYRISLINRRMLESGDIVEVDEAGPGEYFADEMISFSPRRVTIAPQSAQTIRLLVRRPRGDVPDDVEFRTHMSIRSIPATPRLEDIEANRKLVEEEKMSVQPVVTVETVIPILARFGDPEATIELANPRIVFEAPENGLPMLLLDLHRDGERSVYGDLEVYHAAADGSEERIHLARGLAVYSPLAMRTLKVRFKEVAPERLKSGSLRVVFAEMAEMNGDQVAEIIIPLGAGSAATP